MNPLRKGWKYPLCLAALFGAVAVVSCARIDGPTYPDPQGNTTNTMVTGTADTPSFLPAEGSYSSAQNVSIVTATPGASIHYTVDGTPPTTASPLYVEAIVVSTTKVLNAIAVKSGMNHSAVKTGSYTITGTLSPPVFTPAPGAYAPGQSVQLSSPISGAVIHYTLDGSAPTSASPVYTAAIVLSATAAVSAYAAKPGWLDSAVVVGAFNIATPIASTPSFSPGGGPCSAAYPGGFYLSIFSATGGATIHYTTDGSAPTASSLAYSSPIWVCQNQTVRAIAVKSGCFDSAIGSASFTFVGRYVTTFAGSGQAS